MTGDAAVRGIRQQDEDGSVAMFSREQHAPYNRPPLSKDLWTGMAEEKIWRQTEHQSLDIFLETEITAIDPEQHSVTDNKGNVYEYEKLLLATGGSPVMLPNTPQGIIYYRTLSDYHLLRDQVEKADTFAVIGGGFIGSEIAAALNRQEKQVTLFFPEDGVGGLRFPEGLSNYLNDYYREKGVEVQPNSMVESVVKSGESYIIQVEGGDTVEADCVIAGLGIKPDTQLAEQAGLQVDNGIVVNNQCQTSDQDIYAAGDVANFHNSALDSRLRVEHEDNANMQGSLAGSNMAGASQDYDYLPMFYSDLFDLGYEAVGTTSSELDIVTDWMTPNEKGVIYYLDEGKVKGMILWNVWGQVDNARELIAGNETYSPEDLTGKISD